MRHSFGLMILVLSVGVSACSGGEILGINSHPAPPTTQKPSPVASASPSPVPSASASAVVTMGKLSGKVVDFDSNAGLSGIPIFLTSSNATQYSQVATSLSDGTFSFTAPVGTYVIAVGTNLSTDTSRATEHDEIFVTSGSNTVAPPNIPAPVPNYTVSPAEASGNFRLAVLSSSEQSCLTGMNSGRVSAGLTPLVEDEEELEYVRALVAEEVAQATVEPSPMYASGDSAFESPTGEDSIVTYTGINPCSSYSDAFSFGSGSSQNSDAMNPAVSYYAGEDELDGSTPFEAQAWGIDPSDNGSSIARRSHVNR